MASIPTTRYEFAGEVKAQVESRLGFRVGGKIIKRQAELGQRVKAGQVLAKTADGNEAVVAAGLLPGMRVVSAGVHVLSPGQKVTIYQQKVAIAPANSVK